MLFWKNQLRYIYMTSFLILGLPNPPTSQGALEYKLVGRVDWSLVSLKSLEQLQHPSSPPSHETAALKLYRSYLLVLSSSDYFWSLISVSFFCCKTQSWKESSINIILTFLCLWVCLHEILYCIVG